MYLKHQTLHKLRRYVLLVIDRVRVYFLDNIKSKANI